MGLHRALEALGGELDELELGRRRRGRLCDCGQADRGDARDCSKRDLA
jgi:hypothetical protein